MKAIRVVAVGLLVAAGWMFEFAEPFFRTLAKSQQYSFAWFLQATTPVKGEVLGVTSFGSLIFMCLGIGLGLLISAIVYAPLDQYLSARFTGHRERDNRAHDKLRQSADLSARLARASGR